MATRPDYPDIYLLKASSENLTKRVSNLETLMPELIKNAIADHERRFIISGVQLGLVLGVMGAIAGECIRVMMGDRLGVLLSSLDLLLRQ